MLFPPGMAREATLAAAMDAACRNNFYPDIDTEEPLILKGEAATTVTMLHQGGQWVICIRPVDLTGTADWYVTGNLTTGHAYGLAHSYAQNGMAR